MDFDFDFIVSGKPLKVKLFSTAIEILYKQVTKALCKFSGHNSPTAHLYVTLDPDVPYYFLLIPMSVYTPCLSFAYYVLICFVAPNCFIKSYLSAKS